MDIPTVAGAVLAIDPGRAKSGIAIVDRGSGRCLERAVVPTDSLVVEVGSRLRARPEIDLFVLGSGTSSRTLSAALQSAYPHLQVELVDEHGSSQRARAIYCRENPAWGWRKLLPQGLRHPERPYDDYVATLLAQEYLARVGSEAGS